MALWSELTIPGKPRLLIVDGSGNFQGWEAEFCDRLSNVLARKGMDLASESPLRISCVQDLESALQDQDAFNCLFLLCHGDGTLIPEGSKLSRFWAGLSSYKGPPPMLFAACTWEDHDPVTSAHRSATA